LLYIEIHKYWRCLAAGWLLNKFFELTPAIYPGFLPLVFSARVLRNEAIFDWSGYCRLAVMGLITSLPLSCYYCMYMEFLMTLPRFCGLRITCW